MCRSVQYESHLELDFLLLLEQTEDVLFYQEQPFIIKYELDGKRRNYYPDVFFVYSGKGVIAEIKPKHQMALYQNLRKWSALRSFCKDNGYGLLITDGRSSIQEIQRWDVDPQFEKGIVDAVAQGPIHWADCKAIRERYSAGLKDFVAVVLRNKLEWRLDPFTVRQV
jgi:hypothetical protein